MKSRIAAKLILFVSVMLLLFALLLGIAFTLISSWHVRNVQREEVCDRAKQIAKTMSTFYSTNDTLDGHGQRGGFGAYLRFIDDIAMTDAWIVDRDSQSIRRSHGKQDIDYQDLPQNAFEALEVTLNEGETYVGENFYEILEGEYLTVSTPIYSNDKSIVGAVLLHYPVKQISETIQSSVNLFLICTAATLLLSVIPTILLSIHFTRPLRKINQTAMQLKSGNYQAKVSVDNCDEIGELANTINILSNKLNEIEIERNQLEQMKDDFISNVSHELRTPVTILRGSIEALRDGVVDSSERRQSYLDQMLSEIIHMQRLINDLLELSRLQNASFPIEKHELDLHDVVLDAVRSMRQLAKDKNIEICLDDVLRSYPFKGDYGRLRQMIIIVIDNAIKFSDPNSQIEVRFDSHLDIHACLSIRDYGSGIAEEELAFLFQRFHKLRYENNKQGTGLGLAIAKQIADRHAIQIEVSTQLGKGTEFRFTHYHLVE